MADGRHIRKQKKVLSFYKISCRSVAPLLRKRNKCVSKMWCPPSWSCTHLSQWHKSCETSPRRLLPCVTKVSGNSRTSRGSIREVHIHKRCVYLTASEVTSFAVEHCEVRVRSGVRQTPADVNAISIRCYPCEQISKYWQSCQYSTSSNTSHECADTYDNEHCSLTIY